MNGPDEPTTDDRFEALLDGLAPGDPLAEEIERLLDGAPLPVDEVDVARSAARLEDRLAPTSAPARPLRWIAALAAAAALVIAGAWNGRPAPEPAPSEVVAAAAPRPVPGAEDHGQTRVELREGSIAEIRGDTVLLADGVVAVERTDPRQSGPHRVHLGALELTVEPLGTSYLVGTRGELAAVWVREGQVRLVHPSQGHLGEVAAGGWALVRIDGPGLELRRLPDGALDELGLGDDATRLLAEIRAMVEPPVPAPAEAPPVAAAPEPRDTAVPPTDGAENPEVEPFDAAVSALESGELDRASLALYGLSRAGDRRARALLATALERMDLPAAALTLRIRNLRDLSTTHPDAARDGTRDAVRLAMVVGSRRPLMELAEHLHPSQWHPSVRSDGWLALGESWRLQGNLSPALKAFSEIDASAAAYARGEYATGVIYRQTGQPWEALAAFSNAWEAKADDIDAGRVREMALWQSARVYEELQRPSEAQARYEVLAIEQSPLSDRAAHRCAWMAHEMGEPALARRWLAPAPGPGVFAADAALLRARIALLSGDRRSASRLLDQAEPDLARTRDQLARLGRDLPGLWAAAQDADRAPELAARLEADPEIAAFRAHLAALAAERRRVAEHPDPAWRSTLGKALDRTLADEQRAVRSQATAAAHAAVIEVQRELDERTRDAGRARRQLGG